MVKILPKDRRARAKAELRESILEAARTLFAQRGYEATTMRAIADHIAYSPPAVYYHFRDKEALVRELCNEDFRALMQAVGGLAHEPDPIRRLLQLGWSYVRFAHEHPAHYRFMFMTPKPVDHPEHLKDIERGNPHEDAYAFLEKTVAEGVEQGRFRQEYQHAPTLAQAIWSAMHGAASLRLGMADDHWIEWSDPIAVARIVGDAMIRGLVRDPDTDPALNPAPDYTLLTPSPPPPAPP